ncbi:MAG TPA: glycosyltransferase, partial [Planctomycetota bacterium]|nr:glycosyltransferase [Planctomycetota bacterium]
MNIVFCGPSASSWSNTRHALTYRSLMKGLCARGHEVLCLERDVPGFAARREVEPNRAEQVRRYRSLEELRDMHAQAVREADVTVVGSRVPDGIAVGEWVLQETQGVTAFYDLDTPLTLAGLESDACDYLSRPQVSAYDLYLSFIGGSPLDRLYAEFGARRPRPLYGSVDTDLYRPIERAERWTLGYAGVYSPDRQPSLDRLLLDVARMLPERRMVVAGSHYPPGIDWPSNVERIERLAPAEHPGFYASQRFALNLTGAQGPRSGFSPSVRIFEAAACGVPILTDPWPGLDVFFRPGHDVLVVSQPADVLACIGATDPLRRRRMADRARARVLSEHSHLCRAEELEGYVAEVRGPHAV